MSVIKDNIPLSNSAAELTIISGLMNNPNIFFNEKFFIDIDDFSLKETRAVYSVVTNIIATEGESTPLTQQDLLSHADGTSTGELIKHFFKTDKLDAVIQNKPAEAVVFENIEKVKKLSILRQFQANGFDVSPFTQRGLSFYNDGGDDYEKAKSETCEIADIIKHFQGIVAEIENKSVNNKLSRATKAFEGLRDLMRQIKETPPVGIEMEGVIYNTIARGARVGKFYLNSAPSGHGKTRQMVAQAASIAFPCIDREGMIVARHVHERVLFIPTEQDEKEIQLLILAHVSGVSESRISLGQLTAEDEDRIETAIRIIELYGDNFVIEPIPDPSIALVKSTVTKNIYKNEVGYVFYDYIFSSPGLLGEFRDIKVREDRVIVLLHTFTAY